MECVDVILLCLSQRPICNSLNAQVLPESEHSVRKEPKKEEALQPDKSKRSSGTQQEADI